MNCSARTGIGAGSPGVDQFPNTPSSLSPGANGSRRFKGTGNLELYRDRLLAERRVWPALDIAASGTRREQLLLPPEDLHLVWLLRKVLSDLKPAEAVELLIRRLQKLATNAEFLKGLKQID
jgi:transcription termination factor Rho